MEAQNTEKRDSEKQKKSKAGRAVAIAVIILLLLALIVCLIIIFTHRHTMTHYAYAEATCTAGGNAEYWYCAGCDGYFEDEEGENEVEFSGLILPAAGHEWMAASCDSPRRCNICGYSDGAALGHSWGDYEFSPSDCGSEGAILRMCTACGEVERIAVPVHGNAHNWGSIAVVQPSCVSAGRAVLTCADCGETVSSVIPATGAHHWDDGKITMPGCTGTGSIIHTCIDCGATETDVIPASGHVWISAGCTSPVTCAVCGATSGSALGHSWGDWTPAGDANHSRECTRCHSVEYEEHDFGGAEYGTCSVCGYTKEQSSKGGTEITMGYDNVTQVFNGSMDMNYDVSGISFSPGGSWNSDFSLNFTAESDMNLSVNISEDWADYYVSAYNTAGVTLEYHPIKFSLFIDNGTGFEAVSDCSDLGMGEFLDALSKNTTLNRTVSAGEYVDLTFRIRASWAFEVIEPDYFEIIGSDGISYKFADDSGYDVNTWYISHLDTALGELAADKADFSWNDTYDMDGNRWIINYTDSYNLTLSYDINIAITQN